MVHIRWEDKFAVGRGGALVMEFLGMGIGDQPILLPVDYEYRTVDFFY